MSRHIIAMKKKNTGVTYRSVRQNALICSEFIDIIIITEVGIKFIIHQLIIIFIIKKRINSHRSTNLTFMSDGTSIIENEK